MSRETDSTSSGAQGRGGAAYPSGTPPYGTRPFPSLHPQEPQRGSDPASGAAPDGAASSADEPRTETTLTTRVRINIPGSRPIPPVVVRKTVDGETPATGGDTPPADLPSGWTVGGGDTPSVPKQPFGRAATAAAAASAASQAEAPEKKDKDKSGNDWFAPRKPVPPQAPASPFDAPPAGDEGLAAGGPAGFGADPFSPPEADRSGPGGADSTQPISLDDFSDLSPLSPKSPSAPSGFPDGTGGPGGTGEFPFPPRTGDPFSPDTPAGGTPAGGTPPGGTPFPSGPAAGPFGSPVPSGPRPFPGGGAPNPPGARGGTPFPSYQPSAGPDAPAGPTTGPVTGEMRIPPGPVAPGAPGGDTLVGGIPKIDGPTGPQQNVTRPVPAGGEAYRFEEEDDEPAPKGRSKLILAAVGLLAAVGVAYGAGLLMDHADVPAGTTVLGVDIGGKSKEEAVQLLDSQFGKRQSDAITLKVGSKQEQLAPSVAGLGIDIDTTVNNVAHRDYNPVVVIGSLFGSTRAAEPDWLVDNEKLNAQLNNLASNTASAGSDGMVKFVDGKAVAVPGKAHESVDVGSSASKVIDAYQQHVATGSTESVTLAVKTVQPKVTQAQLDAALGGFAKTAMSGYVYVKAGSVTVPFSPELTLSLVLTMVPDDKGDLQPHFDLQALKKRYGNAFDGVLLERGNGSKTAVTPQDVASAMMPALRTTDVNAKTVTLPNVAQ